MGRFSAKTVFLRARMLRQGLVARRQWLTDRLLSLFYGAPVQVLPKGHVGLAAALILWFVQDGQRYVMMVRNPNAKDARARLVSCLGLGSYPDMSAALRAALEMQLGKVFSRTVERKVLAADRVAASPLFSYTDEDSGVASPVQVLAWVSQILPLQVDLVQTGNNLELVVVNEATLLGNLNPGTTSVSPTHKAIWQSVARHLPAMKNGKVRADAVEEVSVEQGVAKAPARTLH